jgi:hypothetical protein
MSANSRSLASCGIVTVSLDLGASSTSKTEVRVEETNVSGGKAGHIDLDELAAGEDIGNSKEHIDKLRNADLARISDLNHWHRVVGVFELGSGSADLRPNFSVESIVYQPIGLDRRNFSVTYRLPGGITRVSLTR